MFSRSTLALKRNQKSISILFVFMLMTQTLLLALTPMTASANSNFTMSFEPYSSADGSTDYRLFISGKTPSGNTYNNDNGIRQALRMDGEVVFCLEMGVPARSGPGYKVNDADRIDFNQFGKANQDLISRIIYYGYVEFVNHSNTV